MMLVSKWDVKDVGSSDDLNTALDEIESMGGKKQVRC
jgi:hypothetical protein